MLILKIMKYPKTFRNQSGIVGIIEIMLVVVALVVVGYTVMKVYQTRQHNATQPPAPSMAVSPTTSPTPDPYVGWQTFTGTCSGFNFKYPAGWSLKLTDSFIDNDCQYASVTSPSGNIMMWVPSYYGDGPGCDFSNYPPGKNDCPFETTIKSESLNLTGELNDVYLVEQVLCDEAKQCEGRVALAASTPGVPRFTVGAAHRYWLVVFGTHAMYMTQGKQTSIGNPTIPLMKYTEASARVWLASDDVKNAELAMKSLVKAQ